jgi:uncharacterized protein YbaR (Trm112 family)
MHLLVTDRLACPRCGPGFGLILLARRMSDRRVQEGTLGCSNCREQYPVEDGVADLRPPPRPVPRPLPPPAASAPEEEVVKVAALLGLHEGPAQVLLAGEALAVARGLPGLVSGVEVVTVEEEALAWPETPGVSRLRALPGRLPLQSRSLRGIALGGAAGEALLDEAVRVLASGGRLAVLGGGREVGRRLMEGGLGLLLDHPGAVVATCR